MRKHSAIIAYLHSPREKIWGIILSIETSGVTVRGIDLNSFDDWCREVSRDETTMGLSTAFFPMHRVERILLDENVGDVQSLAQVFESRVGMDVWSFLDLSRPDV
jgi:hypothetical protein